MSSKAVECIEHAAAFIRAAADRNSGKAAKIYEKDVAVLRAAVELVEALKVWNGFCELPSVVAGKLAALEAAAGDKND